MTITSTDRIERRIVLKAPRSRVWRALSNAEEFGNWFGVALKGRTFTAGKRTQGQITHPGYERDRIELFWNYIDRTIDRGRSRLARE